MQSWDKVGLVFFLLVAVLAGFMAAATPSVLAWISVPYYLYIAFVFTRRRPAVKWSHIGLWLGLIAAFLPMESYPSVLPLPLMLLGLAGYALIFWSIFTLGGSFGIAPADRGLVKSGPYRFIRHPMYLGELLFRGALVAAHFTIWNMVLMIVILGLQVARICLEEKIIAGYDGYATTTRWRLIPGVW